MTETTLPSARRLLTVDDHEVVRGGLVALLERREAIARRLADGRQEMARR